MRIPSFLSNGDTIGIVSISNRVRFDIESCIARIESWGFSVKQGKTLSSTYHQFSGTDEERTNDLQDMLDDDQVRCVLFACGGYGATRIIDQLNFTAFMKNPKWLAGYSDLTALHIFLKEKLGVASIHSSMPVDFHKNTEACLSSLESILRGEIVNYSIDSHPFNRNGEADAEICGGNLSLIYSLMGSPTGLDTSETILFIEDIGEKLYHLDRMMINLRRAGKLKGLRGLVCGSFSAMKDNEIPFGKQAEMIILEHTNSYDYPVLFNFPAGHIDNNISFIMGARTSLSINNKTISFTQNISSFS